MGLGDSLTYGVGDTPFLDSYRFPLSQDAAAAYPSLHLKYIGNIVSGQPPSNSHEGAVGETCQKFRTIVNPTLFPVPYTPTIIIVGSIGTNDLNTSSPTAVADFLVQYRLMFDDFRARTPGTAYVVAQCAVPAGPTTTQKANIIAANAQLLSTVWPQMVIDGFVFEIAPTYVVPDPGGYQSPTSVHYNHTGYHDFMEPALFTAFQALIFRLYGI